MLAAVLLLAAPLSAAEDPERQPVPPPIVFPNPDPHDLESNREIGDEVAIVDLARIQDARERLVRRFGLVSVPLLVQATRSDNQPRTWNALLTLAALRDTAGPAPELLGLMPGRSNVVDAGVNAMSGEMITRSFGALLLGCFPWNEGLEESPPPPTTVPGPRAGLSNTIEDLVKAHRKLVTQTRDDTAIGASSALFALAKRGGADARDAVAALKTSDFTHVETRQAFFLAHALLACPDPKPYFDAFDISDVQRQLTAPAALAVAVSHLLDQPPAWVADTERVDRELARLAQSTQGVELAEYVFARAMAAYHRKSDAGVWQRIWDDVFRLGSKDEVAVAGAQALLFCDLDPIRQRCVDFARLQPSPEMPKPLRAFVLLRAGEHGTPDAAAPCIEWIRSGSLKPRPDDRWDPRWYAIVGLLRAVHRGRVADPVLRVQIVEAFRRALRQRVLKPGPVRDAVAWLLDAHEDTLRDAKGVIDAETLARVESSFDCPYGLLSNPLDVCMRRVNAQAHLALTLGGILPSKVGDTQIKQQGERYLLRYLDRFPYFRRLELFAARGKRPPATAHLSDTGLELNR